MTLNTDDLTEKELQEIARSPIAKLAIRCRRLVGTMEDVKQEDVVWDQLVRDTAQDASRIDAEKTAEDVIESFLSNIERYGTLAQPEETEAKQDG